MTEHPENSIIPVKYISKNYSHSYSAFGCINVGIRPKTFDLANQYNFAWQKNFNNSKSTKSIFEALCKQISSYKTFNFTLQEYWPIIYYDFAFP